MKISQAQTLAEYSIFIVMVIIAGVMMMAYMRRGLQGRYADITNVTTARVSGSTMNQYEPYYSSEDYTIVGDRNIQIISEPGGVYQTNINLDTMKREQGGESKQSIDCYDD